MIPQRRPSTARLALRLYGDGTADPLLEMVVGDHGDGHRCRTDLTVAQARALNTAVGGALDAIDDQP